MMCRMTAHAVAGLAHPVAVVRDPWHTHSLAWIHRAEARSIARELGAQLVSGRVPPGALLRLADPVMREVVRTLRVPYFGPGSAALERGYDKYEACRRIADAPRTFLANTVAGVSCHSIARVGQVR